ncbi:MAG: hypothetical protein WAT79_03200 [Saprospiraceae bacterium]
MLNRIQLTASFFLLFFLSSLTVIGQNDNVGIGTTIPDASAILDVVSTDKGILIPRVDTSDVTSPALGLLIFQPTDKVFYFYNGVGWFAVGKDNLGDHIAQQNVQLNGNFLSNDGNNKGLKIMNSGGVVIGDDMTNERFEVKVDSVYFNELEDQSANVTGIPVAINTTISGAQSVEVGQTGNLSKVDVLIQTLGTTSNFQLEIRSGNDPGAGSILSTENFSFSNTTFDTVGIVLTSPIAVTTGDPLTFIIRRLSGDDAEWQRSDTDVYAGGHSFIDVFGWNAVTNKDFWLTTYVEQEASSIISRFVVTESGQIGIGTIAPKSSALVEMVSTEKGVLIPRMTSVQRSAIGSPADGLLVYDTDFGSFWFYKSSIWKDLSASPNQVVDADGDTKIQVEENVDEDMIRFDLGGSERMILRQNASGQTRLELLNNGDNTFIGTEAGLNTTGNYNTANGYFALKFNTSGQYNRPLALLLFNPIPKVYQIQQMVLWHYH